MLYLEFDYFDAARYTALATIPVVLLLAGLSFSSPSGESWRIVSEDPNLTSIEPVDTETNFSVLQRDTTKSAFTFRTGYGSHERLHKLDNASGLPEVDLTVKKDPIIGWNLFIDTENYEFAPQHINHEHKSGEGHAHVFINGTIVARTYGSVFHLYGLGPGEHNVEVALFTNNHSKFTHDGHPVSDSENISVPGNPKEPLQNNWKINANLSRGPWKIRGFWTYAEPENLVGTEQEAFIVHPMTSNYFKAKNVNKSGISQNMVLPQEKDIQAVLKARNAADIIGALERGCADSKVVLKAQTEDKQLKTSRVISHQAETLLIDLSGFRGEEVKISAFGTNGNEGCGSWNGEFTDIMSLYVRAR